MRNISLSSIIFLITLKVFPFDNFDQMAESIASKFDAPIIKIDDLQADIIFLDAREIEEYNVSHIPGAIHVGYKGFNLEKTLRIISKNKTVVVYCSVGYRSGEIAQKLNQNSTKAFNLYGGIFNWINMKRPVEDFNNNKTFKIHGYDKSWSKWIHEGEIVLTEKKSFF